MLGFSEIKHKDQKILLQKLCSSLQLQTYIRREYVGEWDREDNPIVEHRNLFPHCPFMRGQDVGNVPIMVEDSADSDIDPTTSGRSAGHDEVRCTCTYITFMWITA